ncbi:MAG: leucine-rich repeat domain-containing protein, partial [Bacilli bacterium]|nr:leucine-rich repeat domain-containing protein [Bacilli bacterium]
GSGDDKYAIITGYTWNDPSFCPMNVTIPATLGGYDVKYIGENAFDREGLTPKLTGVDFSLALELLQIKESAFKYNEIRELDLSMLNKLEVVGFGSFKGNIIEEVEFSDSITDINGSSFAYNNLTSVTLPDNLDYIGGMVFYQNNLSGEIDLTNCTKLNKIGGYYSESESTYAIGTFEENNITSVKLPNSVEYIGDAVFKENPLKTINIPTSLIRIGKHAFRNNQLESTVVFPNTLLYIGSYAFVNAFSTGAPDFTNASSLKYIYSSAFNSSFTIDHLDLSGLSSLIYIYEHAFRGSQINTIDTTGMTSLRWIMLAAFEGCNITGTLDLSDSTVLLNLGEHQGDSSYYGPFHNNNLTKVVLPNVTANEYGIYDNVFKNNNNLSDVTLGSGLKHIGLGAFYNTSVSEITFPSTLKSFNSNAFRGAKLTNVVLPAGITGIGSNVFYKSSSSNPNLTTITNNTTYSFDWYKITGQGSTDTCSFKAGTCGTITIN